MNDVFVKGVNITITVLYKICKNHYDLHDLIYFALHHEPLIFPFLASTKMNPVVFIMASKSCFHLNVHSLQ